jgi:murein hydrolase activator
MNIHAIKRCVMFFTFCCSILCVQTSFALTEEERQARLQELRSTIEQLQKELNNAKTNREQLMQNLESSETKIGELTKKMQDLKKQLGEKQSHLQQLQADKEVLLSAKKQQQGGVAQQLNAAYRQGQESSIKLLLNQQDPSQLARHLQYYQYFNEARTAKLQEYSATLVRIGEIEPEIVAESEAISRSHADLEAQKKQLQTSQAERKRTLKQLESSIANANTKLQSSQDNRRYLETLVLRVAEVAQKMQITDDMQTPAGNKPFANLKGQLPWPTRGNVLQTFGSPRVADKVRWDGIVIGANEGSPVKAIHQGRVVFADYLRGQGLLIIIDHGAGFMSLYAYNQTLHKNIGDWVNAGDQVAAVGNTGGQSSAGLYFELRFKGEPTDPRPWLRKAA